MSRRVRRLGYNWQLRALMAERGMFSTTDLLPHLAERGVTLSAVQVYRLVVQTPERLNPHVLAALCDILACTPADLIEISVEAPAQRKTAGSGGGTGRDAAAAKGRRPTRARIVRDK